MIESTPLPAGYSWVGEPACCTSEDCMGRKTLGWRVTVMRIDGKFLTVTRLGPEEAIRAMVVLIQEEIEYRLLEGIPRLREIHRRARLAGRIQDDHLVDALEVIISLMEKQT